MRVEGRGPWLVGRCYDPIGSWRCETEVVTFSMLFPVIFVESLNIPSIQWAKRIAALENAGKAIGVALQPDQFCLANMSSLANSPWRWTLRALPLTKLEQLLPSPSC